jgi:hypothetical protein
MSRFGQDRDTVGEDCDLHGLWLVLLESAKDLFLGVDPPPSKDNLCHQVSGIEQLAY